MKLYTLFLKTQDHEHDTLLHGTYPFSSIKGVPHHLRTQSQAFSGHLLSTKQQSRCHLKDVVAVLGTIFLVPIIVLRRFMHLAWFHCMCTNVSGQGVGGMPKKVIVGKVPPQGPTA